MNYARKRKNNLFASPYSTRKMKDKRCLKSSKGYEVKIR